MNALIKTGLTHLGTATGGAIAVVAFMADSKVDLYAIWDQLNVVVAGIAKLLAMITPIATGGYGIWRSTAKNRLTEVAADPASVQAARDMPVTAETVQLSNALKVSP